MKTVFCTFIELKEVKTNKQILVNKLGNDILYYLDNIETLTGTYVKDLYFLGVSFTEMAILGNRSKEAFRKRIYIFESYEKSNIFVHKIARHDLTMFIVEKTLEFGYTRDELKLMYSMSETTLKKYLRDIRLAREQYNKIHNLKV